MINLILGFIVGVCYTLAVLHVLKTMKIRKARKEALVNEYIRDEAQRMWEEWIHPSTPPAADWYELSNPRKFRPIRHP